MNQHVYIWRDAKDPTNFSLGTMTNGGKCVAWTNLYVDGVGDLFGGDVQEEAKKLKVGDVLDVEISIVGISTQ